MAGTVAAPAGQAAAFDALHEQLVEENFLPLTSAEILARLDRLGALLPASDRDRELAYRELRCDWGFPDDWHGQQAYARESLALARAARDDAFQASFHYCHAAALEYVGGTEEVMAAYEAGIRASRRANDELLLAYGLSARAGRHSLLGNQAKAVPDLLAALQLYRAAGDEESAEYLLLDIAICYRRMGEFAKALEYLEQNEAHAVRDEDWATLVSNLLQQGYLAEDEGRIDDAIAIYDRALELARKHQSRSDVASIHLAKAYPAILRGEYRQALQMIQLAQTEFEELGDLANDDMIALRLGQAHAGLGRHVQALADYERAAKALERSGNQRYLAMLYQARASSEHALGRHDAAYADLERFVELQGRIIGAERSQQAQLLRQQFESDRLDLENSRLANETALRERQVEALLQARRWQWTAMALGGALVLLLAGMVVRQLARMRRLRELAATDPLTGAANRRSIERLGEEAIAAARASGEGLCVLILDIDHFKRVNDRFGHLTGDDVLARVAGACSAALRQFDLLGRIGGEEFLVVLPRTGMEQARQVGERIRAAVEALTFDDIDAALHLSISIGIAELRADDADLRELRGRADAALYEAKDGGRNRMVAAP